jgi:hypothetical protein
MKFKPIPHISCHHRHPVPVRPVPPMKQPRVTRPVTHIGRNDRIDVPLSIAWFDWKTASSIKRSLKRLSRRVVRG